MFTALKFDDWMVVVAGLCYAAVAISKGFEHRWPWLGVWASYATANFCLTYLQVKGNG